MERSHFFDLDTLLNVDNKAWIISKKEPNNPILKISKSEFNIIKSGIYRNQDNRVDFNGNIFWLSTKMMEKLKVLLKNRDLNLGELAISLREFIDEELIGNMDYTFKEDVIKRMKNIDEDIYIICPRETVKSYRTILLKIIEDLKKDGIIIKNFYHISETFYEQNNDDIKYKKMKLFVQHLIGYKTKESIFVDQELKRYDELHYYGNDPDTDKYVNDINKVLRLLYSKSDESLKSVIKEDVIEYRPSFVCNMITDNSYNKVITSEVKLSLSSYIKSFNVYKEVD